MAGRNLFAETEPVAAEPGGRNLFAPEPAPVPVQGQQPTQPAMESQSGPQPEDKSQGQTGQLLPGQPGYEDWMQGEIDKYQGESTLGQKWMLNMLDNPVGEMLVRMAAPSEEEAQRAMDFIRQSGTETRKGVGETALTVGTGAVAQPVSGFAGMGMTAMKGPEAGAQAVQETQQAMTYQPRTVSGQKTVQGFGEAMQPVAETWQTVQEASGGAGYEVGGPVLGAIGYVLPDALASLVPIKMAGMKRNKMKLEIADKLKASSAQPELSQSLKQLADTVETGQTPPKQLPAVIKGMQDDITVRSGKQVYDTLADAAERAAGGDAAALQQFKSVADDVGRTQAESGLAKYIADGTNKATTDPIAKEAIKQGYDPGMVTAIKGATPLDKKKAMEMLDIMENVSKNRLYKGGQVRPADVAGKSFLDRVKHLKKINTDARNRLDGVARTLKGKQVSFEKPLRNFAEALDDMGIRFDENMKPIFTDSDIAGRNLRPLQNAVTDMVAKLRNMAKGETVDAYAIHQLKRQIDESVNYGAGGTGLKGKTESIFKNLRHDADEVLDTNFSKYNTVNTEYADTVQAINALKDIAGKKTDIFGPNAQRSLALLLRRPLSNAPSGVRIIDAVDLIDRTARKYGGNFNDDLMFQMYFADELDTLFGPVARTSLAGEASKAVKEGARQATSGKAGAFEASLNMLGKGVEKLRGINQENAFKTMRELLKREPKK